MKDRCIHFERVIWEQLLSGRNLFFLIDRNNGNWLVKYEVKANDERDTVGGRQTAVNALRTLLSSSCLFGATSELFSLFLFFYSVVCIASAPPFARQSTAATRIPGNRVEEFSRNACVTLTSLSLTSLREERIEGKELMASSSAI